MNNKKRQLLVLAVILLGGLIYGYYEYIFSNQMAKINQFDSDIERKRSFLNKLWQIKSDKEETIKRIEALEEELKTINKSIPSDESRNMEFNLWLYNALKTRSITVNRLVPEQTIASKDGQYSSQAIKIDIIGKKEEVFDFIKFLKNQSRKVKLSKAIIQVIDIEQIQANMEIQIFIAKE